MRVNKYMYGYTIQQNWGHWGWEDVSAAITWKEARETLREYRTNQPETPARIMRTRDANPVYVMRSHKEN